MSDDFPTDAVRALALAILAAIIWLNLWCRDERARMTSADWLVTC
jgi:hypothetical protein